jgi:ureidoglycolate lyase
MKTVKVRKLDPIGFSAFGTYASLMNTTGEKIGKPPIEFYRDVIQQNMADGVASFSLCRVEKRDMVIDVTEYHSGTSEGIMPLDSDILIHVGPATPPADSIPLDKIQVFRIPKGTMVVLRSGVWHHAPFAIDTDIANVLIVLPERTYANDCICFPLENKDKIRVEL